MDLGLSVQEIQDQGFRIPFVWVLDSAQAMVI